MPAEPCAGGFGGADVNTSCGDASDAVDVGGRAGYNTLSANPRQQTVLVPHAPWSRTVLPLHHSLLQAPHFHIHIHCHLLSRLPLALICLPSQHPGV